MWIPFQQGFQQITISNIEQYVTIVACYTIQYGACPLQNHDIKMTLKPQMRKENKVSHNLGQMKFQNKIFTVIWKGIAVIIQIQLCPTVCDSRSSGHLGLVQQNKKSNQYKEAPYSPKGIIFL